MGRRARTRISRSYDVDLAHFDPSEHPRKSNGEFGHGNVAVAEKVPSIASVDGSMVHEQELAQAKANSYWAIKADSSDFYDNPEPVLSMAPGPVKSWAAYQLDGGYQAINGQLREGHFDGPRVGVMDVSEGIKDSPKTLAENMVKAFSIMGRKTKAAGTLFRTVDADKVHIGQVGDVFTDKGVASTAARTDDIASLLDPPMAGVAPIKTGHPLLLQIRVPAGTTVLGGAEGGIETMLPPGTKYRVTSRPPDTVTIGGEDIPNYRPTGVHTLPTVIVEVLP